MKGLNFEYLFRDNYIPQKCIVYNQRSGDLLSIFSIESPLKLLKCSIKYRLPKTYHFKNFRFGYTFMTFEVVIRSFVCISTTKTFNICLHYPAMSTSTPISISFSAMVQITIRANIKIFIIFTVKSLLGWQEGS